MPHIISFDTTGSFSKTDAFLQKMKSQQQFIGLEEIAEQGVAALSAATPRDSGLSADSWHYEIKQTSSGCEIAWTNSHVDEKGVPIVILIQYGHGTGTGGYVEGRDFITPAIKPIFDRIEQQVWRVVSA